MWLNKTDNSVIRKSRAITVGDVQYPRVIFSKFSEVELNALNIFTVTEDAIPNRRYYAYKDELDVETAHITRTPVEKSLTDIQDLMLKDLETTASSKFDSATAGYTPSEMSSWNELEADAIAHQTTPLISGMLYDEATISGITVDELATKVLTNATAFKQVKSYISGTRKAKSLEILSLKAVTDCIGYEKTPYDYTITAEDVLVDSTLIEGTIVTRYRNSVKDW